MTRTAHTWHWIAGAALLGLLAASGFSQSSAQGPEVAAASRFVDVHAHWEPAEPQSAAQAAIYMMPRENAARIILMPPPFGPDDPGRYDAEAMLPAVKQHAEQLAVLGGGGSLNVMIQQSVQMHDSGPEVQRKFRERAEELLREGVAGFGEMSAEHFQGGTSYQSAPPDHPLFLLLADIAAEHGVPIDLHMEAVPQTIALPSDLKSPPNPPRLAANIAAFERLLAHNRRARIIWAHAGLDNTGYRTPGLCRRLLHVNPNLYMEIKVDPLKPGKNSPLTSGASGSIKPEWLKLFQDFPDRFVVGTDQHYPQPKAGPQRWEAIVHLLNQLPDDLRRTIGTETAARLYPTRTTPGSSIQPLAPVPPSF